MIPKIKKHVNPDDVVVIQDSAYNANRVVGVVIAREEIHWHHLWISYFEQHSGNTVENFKAESFCKYLRVHSLVNDVDFSLLKIGSKGEPFSNFRLASEDAADIRPPYLADLNARYRFRLDSIDVNAMWRKRFWNDW